MAPCFFDPLVGTIQDLMQLAALAGPVRFRAVAGALCVEPLQQDEQVPRSGRHWSLQQAESYAMATKRLEIEENLAAALPP